MKKTAIIKYLGFIGVKTGVLSAFAGTILTTAGIYAINRIVPDDPKNPASRLDDLKDAALAGLDVGQYLFLYSVALTGATVLTGVMAPCLIPDSVKKEIEAEEARDLEKEDGMSLLILDMILKEEQCPHGIPMDSIPARKHEGFRRLAEQGKIKIQMVDGVEMVTMPSKESKEDKDELVEKMLSIHARSILEAIRESKRNNPHGHIILEDLPSVDQEIIHHMVKGGLLTLTLKDGKHVVTIKQTQVKVPTSTSN